MSDHGKSANQAATVTRREFIRTAAAAGAVVTLGMAPRVAQAQNKPLGVGFIGVGGRGNSHLQMVHWLQTQGNEAVKIAAVCDVYRPRLQAAVDGYGVKGYSDHRELLADKNVDVVCIATPDHLHALHTMDAVAAGKDVYCEKPFTHWRQFDLLKKAVDKVRSSGRVFQLGTQAMSDPAWRQMKKLVKDGVIGQPLFGETGFFRVGDWGERGMPIDDPNAKPGPDLNWEAFLGEAPKQEFSVDRFFRWRLFKDYAGGPVTDLYPHTLTQVVDMLGLGFPCAAAGLGGIHRYEYELREVPDTFNLLLDYPEKVSVSVLGTQGNDFQGTERRGSGQRIPILRGWEGTLTLRGKEIVFTPAEGSKAKPQTWPIEGDEDNIVHWRNLLDCCRRRDPNTWSPIDLADRVQTTLIMAAWSYDQGRTAKFERKGNRIII